MHARLAFDGGDSREPRVVCCSTSTPAASVGRERQAACERLARFAPPSFPFGTGGPPLRRERNACRHPHIHARHTVTLVRSDTTTAFGSARRFTWPAPNDALGDAMHG